MGKQATVTSDRFPRILDAGDLAATGAEGLADLVKTTKPAELTRNIIRMQNLLITSGKAKTIAQRSHAPRVKIDEAGERTKSTS